MRLPTVHEVQGRSALVFAAFAVPHLINTAVAALGPTHYDHLQTTLRTFYTHPVAESIIILSAATHIGAGVYKRITRPRGATGVLVRGETLYRAHLSAGYILALIIPGHVYGTRFLHHGNSHGNESIGYHGLVATVSVTKHGWFGAYYCVLGCVGAMHVLMGLPKAVALCGRRPWVRRTPTWVVLGGVAAVLAGVLSICSFSASSLSSGQKELDGVSRVSAVKESFQKLLPPFLLN
eukprot:PhM_4_TR16615/c0_g1_i1/m.45821